MEGAAPSVDNDRVGFGPLGDTPNCAACAATATFANHAVPLESMESSRGDYYVAAIEHGKVDIDAQDAATADTTTNTSSIPNESNKTRKRGGDGKPYSAYNSIEDGCCRDCGECCVNYMCMFGLPGHPFASCWDGLTYGLLSLGEACAHGTECALTGLTQGIGHLCGECCAAVVSCGECLGECLIHGCCGVCCESCLEACWTAFK